MVSKSLLEMTKGRVREFMREPSAMWFVILMPIVWMLALGFVFTGETKELHLVGIEKTADYHGIESLLKEEKYIKFSTADMPTLKREMNKGNISIIVKKDEGLSYIYDRHNDVARKAYRYLDDRLQRNLGREDVISSSVKNIEVPGNRYIDFLVPSLLALSIMTTSLFGTGMTIVVNRRENLLKRYLTTPMSPSEYIISHVLGRYLILFLEIFVILTFAWLVFDFGVKGNLFAFILYALLGAGVFASIGIFFGARTKDAGRYNGMVNLLSLPMMMLSGVWFSRSSFPNWLYEMSNYLPLTPLVDGLRRIALEGDSFFALGSEIMLMVGYLVGVAWLARVRFKWY